MKGHNELHFNHATVIDAFQMYLDAKLKDKVKVVSVAPDRTGISTGEQAVIVHVEEPA